MIVLPTISLLGGGGPDTISLSAVWGNITALDGGAAVANANVTLTFSGGSRQIRVDHLLGGSHDFEYRINSGTYTNCPDETLISVSSGDTLNFRVNVPAGTSGPDNIDLYDYTYYPGTLLDRFTVTVN